jgi:hypothetical protein
LVLSRLQVALQHSEPLGGGRQGGEIAGEAGHLCSPCPADRSEPAVAAKIGQPPQIGVGQDTKLGDGRDLPAHPGDEQIRPAPEPVLSPGGRLRRRGRTQMLREPGSDLISASLLRPRPGRMPWWSRFH